MACQFAFSAISPSPLRDTFYNSNTNNPLKHSYRPVLLSSTTRVTASYNTVVREAVRLLGPPARFEASKLKVVKLEEELNNYSSIIPRTYILSHCDFTANLTLTISNVINLEQLKGWYSKDDVVAEWKKVKDDLCLHVHCFVSGPNLVFDLAAEFRYQIFTKELPLVLEAIQYGDPALFREHPELMDSVVRVYFHSSIQNYNRVECWGPLKRAVEGTRKMDESQGLVSTSPSQELHRPKSILQKICLATKIILICMIRKRGKRQLEIESRFWGISATAIAEEE